MPLQDTLLPGWMQGSPAVQTLARTLLARYPAAFRAEGAEVRPLKIGIDRDLQQALDVDPAVLRTVLGGYTRRRAYRAALAAPGAMRVDLAGQPVEPVTAAQQQWARQAARPRPGRRAAHGRWLPQGRPWPHPRRECRGGTLPRISPKEARPWQSPRH